MGAKSSRHPSSLGGGGAGAGNQPSDSSSSPRPTPHIEAPYTGPWAEYQFVDVTVPVETDAFSFSDVSMSTTQTSSVLAELAGLYTQGYSLVTFCRVPVCISTNQRRVFSPGKKVRYQGIFCRYEGDPGNEGWNLRAEKSLLHAYHVTPGMVTMETGPGAQHVQQVISSTVQTGGRLLTLQWSGQPLQSATEAGFGVDVFFEVPDEALPERSVYQLVTAPATMVKRSLFASKGHVSCDWTGIMTRHLSRGWRLVDIFCEAPLSGSALSPAGSKIQTVWFFEKPESRARDDCAVYEGSVVEHWVEVSSSSSSSSSSASVVSGGGSGCLGGGKGPLKKGGTSSANKRNSNRRLASMRKKDDDVSSGGSGSKQAEDRDNQNNDRNTDKRNSASGGSEGPMTSQCRDKNNSSCEPNQEVPCQTQSHTDTAGWEGIIRSMGEKGWELASVVNTLETQAVSGRPKLKVLLVFQRRISLGLCLKGRRTSEGLILRADAGASSSVICDVPAMTGETSSHLNPSLAVRLPLSRSVSREHDDFTATSCDDDIPSTVGGPCSRAHSTTELSIGGRGYESSGFLEPSRGSRRGRELQAKSSLGDEGSIGTGGRSSTSSQHSRVTAAEVHTSVSRKGSSGPGKSANSGKRMVNKDGRMLADGHPGSEGNEATQTAQEKPNAATTEELAPVFPPNDEQPAPLDGASSATTVDCDPKSADLDPLTDQDPTRAPSEAHDEADDTLRTTMGDKNTTGTNDKNVWARPLEEATGDVACRDETAVTSSGVE